MKPKLVFLPLLVIILSLSACSSARSAQSAADMTMPSTANAIDRGNGYEGETAYSEESGIPSLAASTERVVIKNAAMEIVADDPAAMLEQIKTLAEDSGGFIVRSNLFKTASDGLEVPGAFITVRVPAEQLEEIMRQIEGMLADPEQDIQYANIIGEDVTAQYTDLQSRLRNLEDAQIQLQAIMDEATRTEDVLAVYAQLNSINEQIEVLRGQIKYYDESARLSALEVNILAREGLQEISIGTWQPKGVALNAIQALVDTLKFLADAAIWIILYLLPVAIVILIPVAAAILIIRAAARRRKQRRALKQPVNPQPPAES